MNEGNLFFDFDLAEVHMSHFYVYFACAAITAFYLVYKSDSKYKIELFCLSFYLLTGNTDSLLTIKIPGFSLFEIQPIRLIFFILAFLVLRKTLFSSKKLNLAEKKIPWYMMALLAFVIWHGIAIFFHISHIGVPDALKTILDAVAFLVIVLSLYLMADLPSYNLIGKSIIIGGVASSIVCLIQFSIDPYFLRIGDARPAFGQILRSNGLFSTEYYNSYFLIIAVSWALVTIKNNMLKTALIVLFSLGVICSFQRMSWLILALVFLTYFVFIKKTAVEKLFFAALSCFALVLSLSIFYYQDIMNSSVVEERLADTPGGRADYYSMVLDNIDQRPVFGFGDLKNDVYYTNLLRITYDRDRATATTGDLHSGYFSALFLYGVPGFVCFTLFVLLCVIHYSGMIRYNLYFAIPFLVSILYLIGNLTNNFLFLKYISVLLAIHIGIGSGINRILNRESMRKGKRNDISLPQYPHMTL